MAFRALDRWSAGSLLKFCQLKKKYIFVSHKNWLLSKLKLTTVAYENNDKRMESVYSKRIRAGKRRTYFFDVRATRGNDYYLTITESRKRFNDNGYDRHKIFLYKEDFNKFINGLTEAVNYVKTELMPDFDFDAYNHDNDGVGGEGDYDLQEETTAAEVESVEEEHVSHAPAVHTPVTHVPAAASAAIAPSSTEEVDKW
jgi:hypothetical protein